MKISRSFSVLAATIILTGCAQVGQPNCPAPAEAEAEIERTINGFFDALRDDDEASFKRLTTEQFYSFDVGKRFEGTALVDAIRDAHEQGVQINWSIGPLDTKLRCDVAWSAWENEGSAGIPPDLQPVRWLESAVMIYENGSWKIDFFHSQRATEN